MSCNGAHDPPMAPPERKSRKRKKAKIDFYGYDPSILVIEGDPRLSPPPDWFGVNYHASQPVSNSWIEWSGSEKSMFDISKNVVEPIAQESSLSKESEHKKRTKRKVGESPSSSSVTTHSEPSKSPPPNAAAGSSKISDPMTLHPYQPTNNTWGDWDMEICQVEEKQNSKTVINSVIKETHTINKNVAKLPVKGATKPGSTKTLAKVNRIRKILYTGAVAEQVHHLEGLKTALEKALLQDKVLDENTRGLISTAAGGDSTDSGIQSHRYCDHSRSDITLNETPQDILEKLFRTPSSVTLAETLIKDPNVDFDDVDLELQREAMSKIQVRRMSVFLNGSDNYLKKSIGSVIVILQNEISHLERNVTALLVLLKRERTGPFKKAPAFSTAQALKLNSIYIRFQYEKMQLTAMHRILCFLGRSFFTDQIAKVTKTLKTLLNPKQFDKLLIKTAYAQPILDSQASVVPLETLLKQLQQYSSKKQI